MFTNDKVYEVHVKKLKEVNGLKIHNLLIKEDSAKNPLIYINNPVETRVPNPYLSLTEFQQLLMSRAAANKAPTTKAKLQSVNYGPNKYKPTRTVWRTKPNSLKTKFGNPRSAKGGKSYMRSNLKTNRDTSHKLHGMNPTENNSNKEGSFSDVTLKPNAKSQATAIDLKTTISSVADVTESKKDDNSATVSEKSEIENLVPIMKSDASTAVIEENGDKNKNGDKSADTATQNSENGETSTDAVETDEATTETTIADSITTTTTTRRTLGVSRITKI